ncbi:putative ribonuclease H-like domain-containing protein [Tanacetum coccineum]
MLMHKADPRQSTEPVKIYILLPLWTADGSKPSSDNGKKVDEDPRKESEYYSIFDFSSNDKDDGAEADMNNLDTTIQVSHILTTRIHKDHPLDQVIGDLQSATQKRKMSKNLKKHEFEEPKKVIYALKDPSWIEAMQEELLQFKNKKDEKGIVIRNKVRLVTQGYTQEEGIDYDEVFAPVARIEAIRLFLAYVSFKDFVVYQIDVKSAFLYGKIEEEVYACQPPRFEDSDFPDRVYKVEKALYGLHQALRAWYETLQVCNNYGREGHMAQDCKGKAIATGANARPTVTCYDCGEKGHTRNYCPKRKDPQGEEARGPAYVIKDTKKQQDPKCVRGQHILRGGHQLFVAHVTEKEPKEKRLEDVPVIQDFLEVFPDDLPGLPAPRQVEFKIELVPGAAPVARAPSGYLQLCIREEDIPITAFRTSTKVMELSDVEGQKDVSRLKELYWWRNMKAKIATYVSNCQLGGQTLEDMLRACIIDFGSSWDRHLPLVEFSYNNSYHASIKAASYKALYGRKCRSPVCWSEVGDSQLTGPELVRETTEMIVQIKNRLLTARSRQKSYADVRHKLMEF